MCNCGKKGPNLMKARAFMRNTPASPPTDTVLWQVQPAGVTIYVARSGRKYKVRNQYEQVVINQADRPEFEELGYIAPKES